MIDTLFLPLNKNHVLIIKEIIAALKTEYIVLCHDRISENEIYHTQELLERFGLKYRQFPDSVPAKPGDGIIRRVSNFLKIRGMARLILEEVRPRLVVLALDNDPIAQILICEARKRGIKTLMVPEGLLKPQGFINQKRYMSDIFYGLLGKVGIYIKYIHYGSGGCDHVLVSGKRSFDILNRAGIPENRMTIVGQQKYDGFLEKTKHMTPREAEHPVFLYAASTRIFNETAEIELVRSISKCARSLHLPAIVKLHPRTFNPVDEFVELIGSEYCDELQIIKEGYETFELLSKVDIVMTISSAIVLEALMMKKEFIAASYLAGRRRFDYDAYDAIYTIETPDEVCRVMTLAAQKKKSWSHKKRLLEDEIYRLDGLSAQRAADIIAKMAE